MRDSELKTSTGKRVVIVLIAAIMLLGVVLTYTMIWMGSSRSSSSSTSSTETDSQLEELTARYDEVNAELEEASATYNTQYFEEFKTYLAQVKAYNSASAQAEGLTTTDLKTGSGRMLGDGDSDYMAYYIGYCPSGEIFDSSFDDTENPTSLKTPLSVSGMGLIEGWVQGVVGMNLGGVRQITMNSDMAYQDTEICEGETNSPLKFIVLALEQDEKITELNSELNEIYMELMSLYYGASY